MFLILVALQLYSNISRNSCGILLCWCLQCTVLKQYNVQKNIFMVTKNKYTFNFTDKTGRPLFETSAEDSFGLQFRYWTFSSTLSTFSVFSIETRIEIHKPLAYSLFSRKKKSKNFQIRLSGLNAERFLNRVEIGCYIFLSIFERDNQDHVPVLSMRLLNRRIVHVGCSTLECFMEVLNGMCISCSTEI